MSPPTDLTKIANLLSEIKASITEDRARSQRLEQELAKQRQAFNQQGQTLSTVLDELKALREQQIPAVETISTTKAAAIWGKSPEYLRQCLRGDQAGLPEAWIEGIHYWKNPNNKRWEFSRTLLLDWDRARVNASGDHTATVLAHRRQSEKIQKAG